MSSEQEVRRKQGFRPFFIRGLGILLPTVLTIWILVAVYNFVDQKIAGPINQGVRWLVLNVTPWPAVAATTGESEYQARLSRLEEQWNSVAIGNWAVMDLLGLVIAIILIYTVGRLFGGMLGRGVVHHGERLLLRVPLFKGVYPYVKQVTDFFVGDKDARQQFNRVVAVEYPRKGLWSIGLVTGNTMRDIQSVAKSDCMTIFIPSSPTPFTGYVITVPRSETVDLPISIDDALRFCISGGVIVPKGQEIPAGQRPRIEIPLPPSADRSTEPVVNTSN